MKRHLLAAVIAALLPAHAWGDVTIRMSSGSPGAKNRDTGTLYATPDKLAMSWVDEKGKASSRVIFDAGTETMWLINDSRKSYLTMDRETIDQMGRQMDEATAKIEEAMAQLTPEQRKMMEKQMSKVLNAGGGEKAERKVVKSVESKEISGFSCTRYDVSSDGSLVSSVWATPYAQLKVTPGDFAVVNRMGEMFQSITSRLSSLMDAQPNPFREGSQIEGVPILSQTLKNGKVSEETLIESVSHDAPPAGVFDVPSGYKEEKLPKMTEDGR
jgi:hypothetical protein